MHTAAKDGNEFTMKGLHELGAYIDIKDNDGVRETLIITRGLLHTLFLCKQASPKHVYNNLDSRQFAF